MRRFEAALWTTALKIVSAVGSVVLAGVAYALFRAIPHGTRVPFAETFGKIILVVPPATLFFALLFVVSGYELDATALHIRRLLWSTTIPLQGLTRAWHDPSSMRRSLRLFGNGGLFSITGVFRNAALGTYRAFVTDPRQAVVLRFESRVVVISPAHPRAFLGYLALVCPGVVVDS